MNLDTIDDSIEFYTRLKTILSKEPKNDTEAIFLKYVEVKRTARVADNLNKSGARKESPRGERLWISTDVTVVLDDQASVEFVDPDVYDLVKVMQKSRRLNAKSFK
jgi:hypothetical protein